MKKKFLSRAAAIGLVGLTAVPAMSIAASASVTITAVEDSNGGDSSKATMEMKGTAHLVKWSLVEVTTTYGATVTGGNDALGTKAVSAISSTEIPMIATWNASSTSYGQVPGVGSAYYATQKNASTAKDQIDNIIKERNDAAKAAKENLENTIKDYNSYWAAVATAQGNVKKNKDGTITDGTATFTPACEPKLQVTVVVGGDLQPKDAYYTKSEAPYAKKTATDIDNAVNAANTNAKITYYYSFTPNVNTTVSMTELQSIFGKYVVVGADGKISESTSNGTGAITINTTGGVGGSTGNGGTVSGTYGSNYIPPNSYTTTPSTAYYCNDLGYYFPSLASLRAVAGNLATYRAVTIDPGYTYTSSRRYFDPSTGRYFTVSTAPAGCVVVYSENSDASTHGENAVYRVNGLYYYTWTSAYSAAGGDTDKIVYDHTPTSYNAYFSRYNGRFYATYNDAVVASGGRSSYVVSTGYSSSYDYYYDDPYYYWYLNRGNSSSSSSSSSNLGGASVTIGNKSGWSNVRTSIKNAASGATLNVSLGNETSIPEEILTALDGKNVTVNFTLKNGSVISFNGKDISAPKDVYVNVSYNTKNVPSSLVSKAKSVNNAISSSQISVSSNTFGGSASLTVKFGTNRSGCTAKIYRYNSSKNSLQLVDTSTVASTGRVKFDKVTQGGDYVIVLS